MTIISRAEGAGKELGLAIIEMISLMYQNNTARNFLIGLMEALLVECGDRGLKYKGAE